MNCLGGHLHIYICNGTRYKVITKKIFMFSLGSSLPGMA